MSDDMAVDAPFLDGERISIASTSTARQSAYLDGITISLKNVTAMIGGGPPVLCGAVALWAAPVLLLAKVGPDGLLAALANAPLRASLSDLLILLFAVAYLVVTGLLLGRAAERVAPRSRWRRVAARIVLAPMILLSLGATAAVSVPLFLGLIIRCFPSLL
jgi:hypothetical protein